MDSANKKIFKALVLQIKPGTKFEPYIKETRKDYPEWEFIFYRNTKPEKTYLDIYNECCTTVEKENIDAVLVGGDDGAYVLGALCDKYPHLKGPSLEAFNLTADKVATRKYIIPDEYNLTHYALSYKDVTNSTFPIELMEEMKQPLIAKPANGTRSVMIKKISSPKELMELGNEKFANCLLDMMKPVKDILATFLDVRSHPDAAMPTYILEEYIDITSQASIHCSDGLVANGKVIPLPISDNLYWDHAPQCWLGQGIPSSLPSDAQSKLTNMLSEIVEKLVPYGFNNQFIHAEIFYFPNGTFKVMELNGRPLHFMRYVYNDVLTNGNCVKSLLDISQGKPCKAPALKPNKYGLNAYLSTFGEGKGKDFIDFDVASENGVDVRCFPEEDIVQVGSSGFVLAFLNLVGSSLEDCLNKVHAIKNKFLKRPECSPWFFEKSGEM